MAVAMILAAEIRPTTMLQTSNAALLFVRC